MRGSLLDGRDFKKLVDDVEAGKVRPDYIYVYSNSRLSRQDRSSKDKGKRIKSRVDAARISASRGAYEIKRFLRRGPRRPADAPRPSRLDHHRSVELSKPRTRVVYRMRMLNFSGSPALLIPRRAIASWHGIMLAERRAPDDTPDLIDRSGVEWFIWDDFDFEHPKTDYDRVCAHQATVSVCEVAGASALAISDGADSWAWSSHLRAVLSNVDTEPIPIEAFGSAIWDDMLIWRIDDGDLVLMNSSLHGAELGDAEMSPSSDYESVLIDPGVYRVRRACVEFATKRERCFVNVVQLVAHGAQ